jgi:hypothetical protein
MNNRSEKFRNALCYPRNLVGGKTLPVSMLDHVIYKDKVHDAPIVTYYCPSTGDILSKASYQLAINNAINEIYPATDHTPFSFEIEDSLKVLYVTFDCSIRSENAGHPLWDKRLINICKMVKKINADLVFFSEACRKSANVHWLQMRLKITELTELEYCLESTNNFSKDSMSLGVAMFAKKTALYHLESIQATRLVEVDPSISFWGSGCIVVKTKTGTVLVGCQFPIDLKRTGSDNLTGKAMKSLIALLDDCIKSVNDRAYGFGDFNTIEGNMAESVYDVLVKTNWKMTDGIYTFLASYYDEVQGDTKFTEMTDEVIRNIL